VKSEGQIRQQLKQVIFRHLKKRLKDQLRQAPDTCRHNSELEPRDRHDDAHGIQACFFTTDGVPRGVVCDVRYDNGFRAKECPLWESRRDKEDIRTEFQALVEDENRGKLAAKYPDIAALMWVLDNDLDTSESGEEDASQEEMEADEATRGWNWGQWPWSRKR
jgi:hypothetical protein